MERYHSSIKNISSLAYSHKQMLTTTQLIMLNLVDPTLLIQLPDRHKCLLIWLSYPLMLVCSTLWNWTRLVVVSCPQMSPTTRVHSCLYALLSIALNPWSCYAFNIAPDAYLSINTCGNVIAYTATNTASFTLAVIA